MSFKAPKVKQTPLDPVVPLPDMNDAGIRKTKADALSALLKQRGRSSTILKMRGAGGGMSGGMSDPMAPRIKAMVGRG